MGLESAIAKLLLPLLLVVGVLGTHKLALDNGLFALIDKHIASKRIPDSRTALTTHWTGIEGLDHIFSLMVTFFWACLDGSHPSVMLQSIHFIGQLSSVWALLVVESFRVGNAWRIIAFITLWGLLLEWVAMAVAVPLYCFLHLLTSPIAKSAASQQLSVRKTSLLVHPANLTILPWSLAIGHFVPIFMMFYCKDNVVEPIYLSKQFWILIRLVHPLLTAAIHLVLSMFSHSAEAGYASAGQRNREVLRSLNKVYSFATYVAIIPHVATVAFMVVSQLAPALLAPKYHTLFHPYTVFWPTYFWKAPVLKAPNVGVGAGIFLQWDEIVSCAAPLVWAIALNRQALSSEPKASSWPSMLLRVVLMTVVGGPAAAAISLIKERDQVVLDKPDVNRDEKKTN